MLKLHSRSLPRLRPVRIAALAVLATVALVAPAAASQYPAHPAAAGMHPGVTHPAPHAVAAAAQAAAALRPAAARPGAGPPASASLIVTTSDGAVEGRSTADNVNGFLGIPYAAPPTGALRWQLPRPVHPWQGVRPALSYGNRCPQQASGNGPAVNTENCLYLNVFTPAHLAPGTRLPVMVMIHGGGLTTGAGDQHDGSLIVAADHIVVVSINYRLGPLGFLSLPGLASSAVGQHGNFGLADQEAALRWVQRNIGAFGGDPAQVTIAGESAGGFSVCALLASPPAKGLFARAIMESGSCPSQTQATARKEGFAFAAKAGCPHPATVARCLLGKPASVLLAAAAASQYPTNFTAGGPDLPVAPAQAIASGNYTKVPILLGTNRDEARTFTPGFASYTAAQYRQFVSQSYGSLAPQVLARYPFSAYPHPYTASYAIGAIWTDSGFIVGIGGCPEQNLAQDFTRTGAPTYFYEFDDQHAPGLNNNLPGYQWGAGHAMELAYLWPSFNNGYSLYAAMTPTQLQLSSEMVRYWGAFVATGSPHVSGQAPWPQYSSGALMSLREGGRSRAVPGRVFAAEHQCSFWNGHGATGEASRLPS